MTPWTPPPIPPSAVDCAPTDRICLGLDVLPEPVGPDGKPCIQWGAPPSIKGTPECPADHPDGVNRPVPWWVGATTTTTVRPHAIVVVRAGRVVDVRLTPLRGRY